MKKPRRSQFLPSDMLNQIEGYIDREEGDRLARYAAAVPSDQAIVELGSASGAGLAYLAAGARAGSGARVYAIDPYVGDDEERTGRVDAGSRTLRFAHARMEYLGLSATWIHQRSLDAAGFWGAGWRAVGLLHVDGLHDYENVSADLGAWAPHMPEGAIVICHDYNARPAIGEVARAVSDVAIGEGLFEAVDSYAWTRYPKRRGQWIGRRLT